MKDRPWLVHFLFWGLGMLGTLLSIMFVVDVLRYLLFNTLIIWPREIFVPVLGVICLYFSISKLSNLGKQQRKIDSHKGENK